MRKNIRVAQVGYYNTLPFLYGLENSDIGNAINLIQTNPADCACLFKNDKVDIALVPVAALSELTDYKIFSDWCIGCEGEVRTVKVFSNAPFDTLDKIILDTDSRTSAQLVEVLQLKFLNRKIEYSIDIPTILPINTGLLKIGDKVISFEEKYKYETDLGIEWKEHTGLPFVFAVWVSSKNVDSEILNNINNAFTLGIKSIPDIVENRRFDLPWLEKYFRDHISFEFDEAKKEALTLFQKLVKEN